MNGPETPLEREGFRQRVRRTARIVAIGYARIAFGVGFLSAVADRFVLLFAFAAGMSIGTGVKTALDASVFAASAGAFLLALGADVCEA